MYEISFLLTSWRHLIWRLAIYHRLILYSSWFDFLKQVKIVIWSIDFGAVFALNFHRYSLFHKRHIGRAAGTRFIYLMFKILRTWNLPIYLSVSYNDDINLYLFWFNHIYCSLYFVFYVVFLFFTSLLRVYTIFVFC